MWDWCKKDTGNCEICEKFIKMKRLFDWLLHSTSEYSVKLRTEYQEINRGERILFVYKSAARYCSPRGYDSISFRSIVV